MDRVDSRARAYFERFTSHDGALVLQQLVQSEDRTFEDEQLDFKHGKPRDEDIDGIWSKALGAFANNQGGVIVWGIQADRDNVKKLDYAHALTPVPDVGILRDKLAQKYRFLTDPPLEDVQIVAVPFKGEKQGFVVCFVPEGSQKAYRSLRAKFPYFIRIGGDAVEISNGLLRQLFYPKTFYKLSLCISAQKTVPRIMKVGGKDLGISHGGRCVEIGVRNDGEFSVYEAMLLVKIGKLPIITWTWDRFERSTGWGSFVEGAIVLPSPLHPSLSGRVNVMAAGSGSKESLWTIRVVAKDMTPFNTEIAQSSLPVETGEPLVIPVASAGTASV